MPTLEEYRNAVLEDLSALGIGPATETDLDATPLTGIDFGAQDFIAHWHLGRYWFFMTTEDYIQFNSDEEASIPAPDVPRTKNGEYFQMYYKSKAIADEAYISLVGGDFKPRRYWVMWANTSTMKNTPDLQKFMDGFGETMVNAVRITALENGNTRNAFGNRKDRHEFNFLALPKAVQVLADLYGIEGIPEYDLSMLTSEGASDGFDDETFFRLCGHPDGKYDGVFATQRAALWAALGEPDVTKVFIKGSTYTDSKGKVRPTKEATDSDQLSKCLAIAQQDNYIWARVTRVPNPRSDGYPVPTVTEIFQNEEHATLVAQAEMAERGGGGEAAATVTGNGKVDLKDWDSIKAVADYCKENNILPLPESVSPPARAKMVDEAFLNTWDDLVAVDAYARGL